MFSKLEQHKNGYRIELPKELIELKGLTNGNEFATIINEKGNIELQEITLPFSKPFQYKKK